MMEFSPSKCQSEKHHQFRHYAHHRTQLGSSALEMAFKHTHAVGFKKQVQCTNKSTTTKSEQAMLTGTGPTPLQMASGHF